MQRLVRDTIEVRECDSLDRLLERLQAVRTSLPNPEQAQVKLRGDDVFGRLITIRYTRPMTAEEIACEARYASQEGLGGGRIRGEACFLADKHSG